MTTAAASYWQKFLQRRGCNSDKRCAGEMCFEAEGFFGDELLALVLAGKKTAFFSSYVSYIIDNDELPATGEMYVVLDRSGSPRCIIELTSVRIVPFCEVTHEMVIAEGEDESLETWREKEKGYLEVEGEIGGFAFAEDIKLVFHEFRIVD
ncbi:ASCH domain-containing protein [Treponema socranskii]